MSRWLAVCLCAAFIGGASVSAEATEWFVAPGGTGTGTVTAPFGRIQSAITAAQPGDTVTIAAGTYAERLQSARSGSNALPIRIRAAGPRGSVVVSMSGRLLTLNHSYITVEGLVFDGQYGNDDTVRLASTASSSTLRNLEVRRSTKDLIDMGAPQGVLIEDSLIHHALNAANGRTDAHGVVAGAAQDLVIRNTEIHTFSGDAIQLDPGRNLPGWNRLTIEKCRFWLAPLPAAENGFAAGTVPGENALDTKTNASAPRATIAIRDTVAYGFRNGLISNMAAFNLKENVDATVDGVTVYDSEIAFRTRGPGSNGGAWVTVKNAVIYNVAKAYRYEDDIQQLRIWNSTLGRNVAAAFQAASSNRTGLNVRNLLMLGGTRPVEAPDPSNLVVTAVAFVNAAADNYGLVAGSAAVDAGTAIPEVTSDRIGVARPQGQGYDVGAFELTVTSPVAEVIVHAWHAPILSGGWRVFQDATAADGLRLSHPNGGATAVTTPLANPSNYFELQAWIEAGVPYHLWIRGKASGDLRSNDSVYVQFSTSVDASGNALYRIGTTSGALVQLADCNGCYPHAWGWQDNGTGKNPGVFADPVYFAITGWETIRIQTREDGLSIDQLVLSPALFLNAAPGMVVDDTTIWPES
jgi:hypothetical protein